MSAVQAPLQRDADLREQNERLKGSLDKAAIDIGNLQTELTAALRRNTYLERQVAKVNQKQVPQSDVIDVFDHYLAVVWTGRGRRPVLDAAKEKLIRGRLRDRSVADLKLAIAGLAKKPNVGDKGRCGPGEGRRFADLRHCLADDDTALRFIGYVEDDGSQPARPGVRVVRRVDRKSGQELADLLDFGHGLQVRDLGHGRWMAQCPAHDDRDPSLSFKECDDGRILVNCFAGCPTEAVMDAVGWEMLMLRGRS